MSAVCIHMRMLPEKPCFYAVAGFGVLLSAIVAGAATTQPDTNPTTPATTQIASEIAGRAMAVVRENCLNCHNSEKKKGGLILTSRTEALKGGENGVVLIPGNAAHSLLAAAVLADADPHMPPKGQLSADQIALLQTWIDSGALWDEKALLARATPTQPTTHPVALRPLPLTYRPVMAMALSPDQKRLAAGRGDRILIFDLARKEHPVAVELSTPHDLVQSLAWGADGKSLASGGFRTVRLWDMQPAAPSTQPARQFSGFSGRVTALCFTPDGHQLIAGGGEGAWPGMIRSWQIPDGRELMNWLAHGDAILSLKVSGDGKFLASGGADKLVKLWELPSGKELGKFEGHSAQVMAIAFNRDATLLASGGADKEIKVWDLKTRDQTLSLVTNPAGITDLAWIDDKVLLSTCEDGIARFSSGDNREGAQKSFSGAADVLYCAVATKDGMIYSGCHDGYVYYWTVATGKLEGKLPAEPTAASQAAKGP